MMRMALSAAGTGLLRALLRRARRDADRILLTAWRSVDWHSLTFVGERHEIEMRILPPHAEAAAEALARGLADADFVVPGQIVADIHLVGAVRPQTDGSVALSIEALTISE